MAIEYAHLEILKKAAEQAAVTMDESARLTRGLNPDSAQLMLQQAALNLHRVTLIQERVSLTVDEFRERGLEDVPLGDLVKDVQNDPSDRGIIARAFGLLKHRVLKEATEHTRRAADHISQGNLLEYSEALRESNSNIEDSVFISDTAEEELKFFKSLGINDLSLEEFSQSINPKNAKVEKHKATMGTVMVRVGELAFGLRGEMPDEFDHITALTFEELIDKDPDNAPKIISNKRSETKIAIERILDKIEDPSDKVSNISIVQEMIDGIRADEFWSMLSPDQKRTVAFREPGYKDILDETRTNLILIHLEKKEPSGESQISKVGSIVFPDTKQKNAETPAESIKGFRREVERTINFRASIDWDQLELTEKQKEFIFCHPLIDRNGIVSSVWVDLAYPGVPFEVAKKRWEMMLYTVRNIFKEKNSGLDFENVTGQIRGEEGLYILSTEREVDNTVLKDDVAEADKEGKAEEVAPPPIDLSRETSENSREDETEEPVIEIYDLQDLGRNEKRGGVDEVNVYRKLQKIENQRGVLNFKYPTLEDLAKEVFSRLHGRARNGADRVSFMQTQVPIIREIIDEILTKIERAEDVLNSGGPVPENVQEAVNSLNSSSFWGNLTREQRRLGFYRKSKYELLAAESGNPAKIIGISRRLPDNIDPISRVR